MIDDGKPSDGKLSRRTFLGRAAIGSGALLGTALSESRASAASKLPQKAVQYQPIPKNGDRCINCTFWQAPAACKVVEGPISPAGWCTLFKKNG